MQRLYHSARFIRETIVPLLASRTVAHPEPILAIDEGLNDRRYVDPMLRRLVANGTVSQAVPLWYQLRVLSDGSRISAAGGATALPLLLPDIGRVERGTFWPDERVVAMLIAHFLTSDKLILLTQNTRNDLHGIRRILQTEVGPTLNELVPMRLGLLALVQKPGTSLSSYCASVEHWIMTKEVDAGFLWQVVSE